MLGAYYFLPLSGLRYYILDAWQAVTGFLRELLPLLGTTGPSDLSQETVFLQWVLLLTEVLIGTLLFAKRILKGLHVWRIPARLRGKLLSCTQAELRFRFQMQESLYNMEPCTQKDLYCEDVTLCAQTCIVILGFKGLAEQASSNIRYRIFDCFAS